MKKQESTGNEAGEKEKPLVGSMSPEAQKGE